MGGSGQAQALGIAANEALAQAVSALVQGRHDARLAEGAQANALESIAWSLIGILGAQAKASPEAAPAARTLSEELRSRGFLQIDPQPQ